MSEQYVHGCKACLSHQGELSLTPIPTIFETDHWRVQHIDNTSVKGWIVLGLNRHAAALHELTDAEWRELAELQFLADKDRGIDVIQLPDPTTGHIGGQGAASDTKSRAYPVEAGSRRHYCERGSRKDSHRAR